MSDTSDESPAPGDEPRAAQAPRGRRPVAVTLWKTAQPLIRGFDALLVEHGASWQVWHILLALGTSPPRTQRELAGAVGIREATLTHHLRAMEDNGLIRRTRMPDNRRVQHVEVTEDGARLFEELRAAAVEFDRRLRAVIGSEDDVARFLEVLGRLAAAAPEGGRDILPEDWPREPGVR
ncbi:MarR family winged helix-turn-helix transcriptional regulator [Myceligenerans pegani]|uniref:Winged helix-turn-helix transcriptional regulator n=1 Tax=Myceligenerans pegani TaxID=2776917 RepID=A0ABR9MS92_9MICO|nr:MarR family winged helix-turn-helix transcriptional regulator [Myceligenerans sp. TRM 65318]MBE1874244.1 winged helix-turn-helix transcriptional regulator [Myceligenerans sp. TRM 65318]MBE3016515.1 winged helix-turn-helix transcriptional regulator [Myceligenerans sp. TRM 65318]